MERQLITRPAIDTSRKLFSFAVIGDTHIKPESGDQSAPWPVNDLATARARWVAREIARYSPRFVVHLGDLVHPVPELPTFRAAVELTHTILRGHHNHLHVLPGNHDIGDKPNRAMPAKMVRDEWIALHERNFGASYSSFDQDGVRFILLNNPVLNAGTPVEVAQRAWLEQTLAEADGRRIFMLMHYPLFLLDPEEAGHYDNIEQPARADMLALIRRYKVEAVFAGHVHNIFYHRLDDTEFYVMPATSFVRQDYAEMYRVEAAPENGRNDAEKLGFAIIDVYADGHVTHYVRSYGALLQAEAAAHPIAARTTPTAFPHPKLPGGAAFGVFLRHGWTEIVSLPHNGPMDEFLRKEARNDYAVAALWRMGLRHARVPLGDLLHPATRRRMHDLVMIGHRFNVFGFGVPDAVNRDLLVAHADLVDKYECVLPVEEIRPASDALAEFRTRLGRPVLLSRIATSADDRKVGSKIELFVSHGWRPDQMADIEALRPGLDVDGFVVRAGLGDDLTALAARLAGWSAASACGIDLHLRVAANNPATNVTDDSLVLAAVAELYAVGLAHPGLGVMLDTFMDIDRGYFVRHGLLDRRYNLRPAGMAVEALSSFLPAGGMAWGLESRAQANGRTLTLHGDNTTAAILLPTPGETMAIDASLQTQLWRDGTVVSRVPLDAPWPADPDIGGWQSASVAAATSRPLLIVSKDAPHRR